MKSNENGGCNSASAYAALNCNKLSDVILRKIGKWLTKYQFHANITISEDDITKNNITSDNIKAKVARKIEYKFQERFDHKCFCILVMRGRK